MRKLGILMSYIAVAFCAVMIIPAAAQAAPIRTVVSQATNCPWSVSSADGGNTVTGDRDKIAVFTKGDGSGVQWNPNVKSVVICRAGGTDTNGAHWGPIDNATGGTHDAAPGAAVLSFTITAGPAVTTTSTTALVTTTTSTTKAPPPSITTVPKKTGTAAGTTTSSTTTVAAAKPATPAVLPTGQALAQTGSDAEQIALFGTILVTLGLSCWIGVWLRTRYVNLAWSHPRHPSR